jgi:hypothetical protein
MNNAMQLTYTSFVVDQIFFRSVIILLLRYGENLLI